MSNIYTNYFAGTRISDGWVEHRNRGSLGGVDYAVGVGTPIKAPTDGQISNIPNNGTGGHTVNLVSPNGYKTQFMHCSRFVNAGYYRQGDIIGYTGGAAGSAGAGSSTGPHCHIHIVLPNGTRVNMLDYVGKDFSAAQTSNTGNGSWEFWLPAKNVQLAVQQGLARLGYYKGTIDGIFGPISKRAIQKFLADRGYYKGAIDGIAGPLTCAALQSFARDKGGYRGPQDKILGPNSWQGFLNGVNAS